MKKQKPKEADQNYLFADFKSHQKLIYMVTVASLLLSISILTLVRLSDQNTTFPTEQSIQSIHFSADNIPPLQFGHYALWTRREDKDVFIKRFNANDSQLYSLNGQLLESLEFDIQPTDQPINFKVTIELEGDRNEVASPIVFLEGETEGQQATLSFFDNAILESPSGSFILATPTDNTSSTNEASGLWFIDEDKQTPSLNLKKLKTNYWSWSSTIKDEKGSINIGDFTNPKGKDKNDTYSLELAEGFLTPGEDLLRNLPNNRPSPINLANSNFEVTISLEPQLSESDPTGPKLFIPILSKKIEESTETHQNIDLVDILDKPKIEITIK